MAATARSREPAVEDGLSSYLLGLSVQATGQALEHLAMARAPHWQGVAGTDYRRTLEEIAARIGQLEKELGAARELGTIFEEARRAALRSDR